MQHETATLLPLALGCICCVCPVAAGGEGNGFERREAGGIIEDDLAGQGLERVGGPGQQGASPGTSRARCSRLCRTLVFTRL